MAKAAKKSSKKDSIPTAKSAKSTQHKEENEAASKAPKIDSDFIFTISDSDNDIPNLDVTDEEEVEAGLTSNDDESEEEKPAPKSKKSKTSKKETVKQTKSDKKRKREEEESDDEVDDDDDEEVVDQGKKSKELNPDFEFRIGEVVVDEGFSGWGFEEARKSIGDKKGVDIDELIKRHQKVDEDGEVEKAQGSDDGEDDEEMSGSEGDDEDDEEEGGVQLDDDEVDLGGFGMGANSDVEEDEDSGDEDEDKEKKEKDDDDDAGSDSDESVASVVPHPMDLEPESDEEEPESEGEQARKAAFFAPEDTAEAKAKFEPSKDFQQMNLSRPILRGLANVGFTTPTPIQQKAIPVALLGKDIVGGAVTGSGKTAAFVVPILERLLFRPKKVPTSRVVILCPTRELAMQAHSVATKLAAFTDIKFCLTVGGLSLKAQEAELRLRPDVIIATPGRFIDHMRNSASFSIDDIEILVLDEADRMLEDGFADELNEIITTLPKSRQTMLFSATMTDSVDKLIRLSLQRPVRLMIDAKRSTAAGLTQEFVRIRPQFENKRLAMLVHLCKHHYHNQVIIFFRSKAMAHRVRVLFGLLDLSAAELHGALSQEQRIKAVEDFRDGKVNYLLCTDLASRGLDIKGVQTVINYEVPQSLEIYLHRVGRTARAGRSGRAITLASEKERKIVRAAVKSAQQKKSKVLSRVLDQDVTDKFHEKVTALEDTIDVILKEEKEEKQMQQMEMQLKKGENLIIHEAEIASRPKRTWFESNAQRGEAKVAGVKELNGEEAAKKVQGKLSNKKRKKMDDREVRQVERMYKKTKTDRVEGGKPGKPPGKGGKGGAIKGKAAKKFAVKTKGKGGKRK
ncbi:DEAD-domain-containing protein [Ascobolus immersus RN42]|uniref:RNA helicase n=1 Tax=Ascobolus immersus RN42 TaxID=1160509 RepID=A0A3N4IAC6_ASCIM|nr:DEAD-domain-containing protein [Ascobolus immersus RN42]